jgi:hypothetical protein
MARDSHGRRKSCHAKVWVERTLGLFGAEGVHGLDGGGAVGGDEGGYE